MSAVDGDGLEGAEVKGMVEEYLAAAASDSPFSVDDIRRRVLPTDLLLRKAFAGSIESSATDDPHAGLFSIYSPACAAMPGLYTYQPAPQAREGLMFPLGSRRLAAGTPCIATKPDFDRAWEQTTLGSLRYLDWDNVVVAGGSVLGCVKQAARPDNDASADPYKDSDIDLFLYGLTPEEAKDKMVNIFDAIQRATPFPVVCFRSKHVVTLVSTYPWRHIQIILRLYQSPAEIVNGFDVDSCAILYDGVDCWITPRAHHSLVAQHNIVDLSRRSPSYEMRLYKYAARGFEVVVPGVEPDFRSCIDAGVFERPFGEVQGLARLVLLELFREDRDALRRYKYKQSILRERPGAAGGLRTPSSFWSLLSSEFESRLEASAGRGRKGRRGRCNRSGPGSILAKDKSDYSTVFLPYGPGIDGHDLVKLMHSKDLVLNSAWFNGGEVPPEHMHPCFFGTMAEVLVDCCGACPPMSPDRAAAREDEPWVSGDLTFITMDPGRQTIGSFNPLSPADWSAGVFAGDPGVNAFDLYAKDRDQLLAALANTPPTVNPNSKDGRGRSLLQVAIQMHDVAVAEAVLRAGGDVALTTPDGKTAFHFAAMSNNAAVVPLLCRYEVGAQPGSDTATATTTATTATAGTATTATAGTATTTTTLPSTDKDSCMTALHMAVALGNFEVAQELVRAGADVYKLVQPPNYDAAVTAKAHVHILSLAAMSSDGAVAARMVEMLIEAGARVAVHQDTTLGGWTPIHVASSVGSAEVLSAMILTDPEAGSVINRLVRQPNTGKWTSPLGLALSKPQPDPAVVDVLLRHGASPTITQAHCDAVSEWLGVNGIQSMQAPAIKIPGDSSSSSYHAQQLEPRQPIDALATVHVVTEDVLQLIDRLGRAGAQASSSVLNNVGLRLLMACRSKRQQTPRQSYYTTDPLTDTTVPSVVSDPSTPLVWAPSRVGYSYYLNQFPLHGMTLSDDLLPTVRFASGGSFVASTPSPDDLRRLAFRLALNAHGPLHALMYLPQSAMVPSALSFLLLTLVGLSPLPAMLIPVMLGLFPHNRALVKAMWARQQSNSVLVGAVGIWGMWMLARSFFQFTVSGIIDWGPFFVIPAVQFSGFSPELENLTLPPVPAWVKTSGPKLWKWATTVFRIVSAPVKAVVSPVYRLMRMAAMATCALKCNRPRLNYWTLDGQNVKPALRAPTRTLFERVWAGDLAGVQALVKHHADSTTDGPLVVTVRDANLMTPLALAVMRNHPSIVHFLIQTAVAQYTPQAVKPAVGSGRHRAAVINNLDLLAGSSIAVGSHVDAHGRAIEAPQLVPDVNAEADPRDAPTKPRPKLVSSTSPARFIAECQSKFTMAVHYGSSTYCGPPALVAVVHRNLEALEALLEEATRLDEAAGTSSTDQSLIKRMITFAPVGSLPVNLVHVALMWGFSDVLHMLLKWTGAGVPLTSQLALPGPTPTPTPTPTLTPTPVAATDQEYQGLSYRGKKQKKWLHRFTSSHRPIVPACLSSDQPGLVAFSAFLGRLDGLVTLSDSESMLQDFREFSSRRSGLPVSSTSSMAATDAQDLHHVVVGATRRDCLGLTSLHHAVIGRQPRAIALCLRTAAQHSGGTESLPSFVSAQTYRDGYTAAHLAVFLHDEESVLRLVAVGGADLLTKKDKHKKWSPLQYAVYQGGVELVTNMVAALDPDARPPVLADTTGVAGWPLLFLARTGDMFKAVLKLVQEASGPDSVVNQLTAADAFGTTLLHAAIRPSAQALIRGVFPEDCLLSAVVQAMQDAGCVVEDRENTLGESPSDAAKKVYLSAVLSSPTSSHAVSHLLRMLPSSPSSRVLQPPTTGVSGLTSASDDFEDLASLDAVAGQSGPSFYRGGGGGFGSVWDHDAGHMVAHGSRWGEEEEDSEEEFSGEEEEEEEEGEETKVDGSTEKDKRTRPSSYRWLCFLQFQQPPCEDAEQWLKDVSGLVGAGAGAGAGIGI